MRRLALFTALLATTAFAGNDTYQVTGPVQELTPEKIVVLKGKERFEISRGSAQATGGELKVGAKVTVKYTITAESIEVKADKAEKPAKAEKPEKKDKK
jgi:hypothetical protein